MPHPICGDGTATFTSLLENNCEHIATFLSQEKVSMMVMTSNTGSEPWKRALVRNSAVFAAQCERHHGSPWHGYAIFDVFLCGCCEVKVCDLCIRKSGGWCRGSPTFLVNGCPGYGISTKGLHHRTPLCNLCGLEENGNRQLCASCYSDEEHELTGDYDDEASDYESGESSWESFAYTSNEEADEESWSDEDMLD